MQKPKQMTSSLNPVIFKKILHYDQVWMWRPEGKWETLVVVIQSHPPCFLMVSLLSLELIKLCCSAVEPQGLTCLHLVC